MSENKGEVKANKKITDKQDELDCIKAYDKIKKSNTKFTPAKKVFALIEKRRLKKASK